MKRPAPVVRPKHAVVRRQALAFQTATSADPLENMTAPATDLEAQQKEIVANLTAAYRQQEREQRAAYNEANSTGYYRVLVFDTEAQAVAFAAAIGADPSMQMWDGRSVADRLNIQLPEVAWRPKAARVAPKLRARALPLSKGD